MKPLQYTISLKPHVQSFLRLFRSNLKKKKINFPLKSMLSCKVWTVIYVNFTEKHIIKILLGMEVPKIVKRNSPQSSSWIAKRNSHKGLQSPCCFFLIRKEQIQYSKYLHVMEMMQEKFSFAKTFFLHMTITLVPGYALSF